MRSLFVKTLLWFLATTAVAIFGIIITTALTFRSTDSRQSPFSMLLNIQVEDAKRAYQTGGAKALANVLARFQTENQGRVVFTDSNGVDLLTGKFRPNLKQRMARRRRRRYFPFFSSSNIIARPDPTRQYWLFLMDSRPNLSFDLAG